jgi:hypothetical protein
VTTATRRADSTSRPATTSAGKAQAGAQACTECGARLSSYNPGPNCFAHTLDIPWKGPGVRPR